ncbi:hypothetical protein BDR04DRAFT_1117167 [Suillus decipiens]|nr:hypothetical protein BDR04DRAFT_1117167 [Suillus decipiens]
MHYPTLGTCKIIWGTALNVGYMVGKIISAALCRFRKPRGGLSQFHGYPTTQPTVVSVGCDLLREVEGDFALALRKRLCMLNWNGALNSEFAKLKGSLRLAVVYTVIQT